MAINKKYEFENEVQELAEFAKAISHPARIAILQTIASKNQCICGEIVEVLPLAQSTVSQHLKELKNVGLIQGDIEGQKTCYCINWTRLEEFHESFSSLMNLLNKNKIYSKQECC
jgi:ArsR family transcriptional regulator, arsenate/arsenite/antimonite-responsive transcriptional repressor